MTKRTLTGAALALLATCAFGERLTFKGVTDKDPLTYKVGEKMTFTVTLVDRHAGNAPVKGRKLVWKFAGDDGRTSGGEATSDEPLVVSTSASKPGFVRLTVNVLDANGKPLKGKTEKFDGGAGADVAAIEALPEPDDFDAFWQRQLDATAKLTGAARLRPRAGKAPAGQLVRAFALPMGEGERPATGVLAMPEGAAPKSLKLKVRVFGYGFGPTAVAPGDCAGDAMVLAVTRHGEEPDRDQAYYADLKRGPMKGFCMRNLDRPETTDQLKMLLRDWRALQWAKTLPEWNGRDISVSGGSMGGFQTIALAALDRSVTFISANIPWHSCVYGKAKFGRMTGWFPRWTDALGYFDTSAFAKRVTCRAEILIGLGDYVCPPSGEMILFRNLKGPKKLTACQNMGHGARYGVDTATYVREGGL